MNELQLFILTIDPPHFSPPQRKEKLYFRTKFSAPKNIERTAAPRSSRRWEKNEREFFFLLRQFNLKPWHVSNSQSPFINLPNTGAEFVYYYTLLRVACSDSKCREWLRTLTSQRRKDWEPMMMQISVASKVLVLISEMRKLRLREAGWESVWGFLKN